MFTYCYSPNIHSLNAHCLKVRPLSPISLKKKEKKRQFTYCYSHIYFLSSHHMERSRRESGKEKSVCIKYSHDIYFS